MLYKPCSFIVILRFKATPRIAVLNAALPVKYNVENAYSSIGENKKSIRLCLYFSVFVSGSFPITKLFFSPLERKCVINPPLYNSFKNISNTITSLCGSVIIISISPESSAPRR